MDKPARYDLINYLINKFAFKSYLEIGIQNRSTFDSVKLKKKVGVEPNSEPFDRVLKMTSDQFFETNLDSFDLIFVDGDHSFEQSYRDIQNALKIVNKGGFIVCHDVLPLNEDCTNPYQNGEVYKAAGKLRQLTTCMLWTWEHDHGCGVISKDINQVKSGVQINDFQDFLNHQWIYNKIKDWQEI